METSIRVTEPHKVKDETRNDELRKDEKRNTCHPVVSCVSLLISTLLCPLLISSHPTFSTLSAADQQFPSPASDVRSQLMVHARVHADAAFPPPMPSQAQMHAIGASLIESQAGGPVPGT